MSRIRIILALAAAVLPGATALAGNVTAVVKHKSLVIKGSAGDDDVVLGNGGPGELTLTPQPGSPVNGSMNAFLALGVTRDVVVDLGAGSDQFVTNALVPRDLRVRAGDGDDVLPLEGHAARDAIIDLGIGANRVILSGLSAGRNFVLKTSDDWDSVKGVVSATRDAALTFGAAHSKSPEIDLHFAVGRRCSLRTRGDAPAVTLRSSEVGGKFSLRIDGLTSVTADDMVLHDAASVRTRGGILQIGQFTCDEDLTVSGRVPFVSLAINDCSVGNDLAVRFKGDQVGITLAGDAVGRDLAIKSRATQVDSLQLTGVGALRDLRFTGGAASDVIALTTVSCGRDFSFDSAGGVDQINAAVLEVDRRARLALGGGADLVSLGAGSTLARLAIAAGSGDDSLVVSSTTITHDCAAQLGSGDNSLQFAGAVTIGGDLDVTAGGGDDTLDTTGATVSGAKHVHLGGGTNTVQ